MADRNDIELSSLSPFNPPPPFARPPTTPPRAHHRTPHDDTHHQSPFHDRYHYRKSRMVSDGFAAEIPEIAAPEIAAPEMQPSGDGDGRHALATTRHYPRHWLTGPNIEDIVLSTEYERSELRAEGWRWCIKQWQIPDCIAIPPDENEETERRALNPVARGRASNSFALTEDYKPTRFEQSMLNLMHFRRLCMLVGPFPHHMDLPEGYDFIDFYVSGFGRWFISIFQQRDEMFWLSEFQYTRLFKVYIGGFAFNRYLSSEDEDGSLLREYLLRSIEPSECVVDPSTMTVEEFSSWAPSNEWHYADDGTRRRLPAAPAAVTATIAATPATAAQEPEELGQPEDYQPPPTRHRWWETREHFLAGHRIWQQQRRERYAKFGRIPPEDERPGREGYFGEANLDPHPDVAIVMPGYVYPAADVERNAAPAPRPPTCASRAVGWLEKTIRKYPKRMLVLALFVGAAVATAAIVPPFLLAIPRGGTGPELAPSLLLPGVWEAAPPPAPLPTLSPAQQSAGARVHTKWDTAAHT